MQIVFLKLSAAVCVFAICVLGILASYKLKKFTQWFDILSAFSGGILIATAYTHMFPETIEQYADFLVAQATAASFMPNVVEMTLIDKCGSLEHHDIKNERMFNYPLIPFLAAFAFILLFLLERGVVVYMHHSSTESKFILIEEGKAESASAEDLGALAKMPELTAFALVIAVSFHAVIEGMGMGATCNPKTLLSTFIGIAIHKGLEGFAVGASLVESSVSLRRFIMYSAVVCLASPLGVLLGYAITFGDIKTGFIGTILGALAVGTFTQVAMMEFLPRTFAKPVDYLWKAFALLAGFGIMSTMPMWFSHSHEHI